MSETLRIQKIFKGLKLFGKTFFLYQYIVLFLIKKYICISMTIFFNLIFEH